MMMVHGFLHLLGYDHEKSRKEELKMMNLQDRLFKTLSRHLESKAHKCRVKIDVSIYAESSDVKHQLEKLKARSEDLRSYL